METKETKQDRIQVYGGAANEPALLRAVVEASNAAGLDGWKAGRVDYGLDASECARLINEPQDLDGDAIVMPPVYITITYERACRSAAS